MYFHILIIPGIPVTVKLPGIPVKKDVPHGYLVADDDQNRSPPFYSQEYGNNMLRAGVSARFITADDAPDIETSIRVSPLPEQGTKTDFQELTCGRNQVR